MALGNLAEGEELGSNLLHVSRRTVEALFDIPTQNRSPLNFRARHRSCKVSCRYRSSGDRR